MIVDKRKILLGSLGTGTTIDIALGSDFFPVDNSELVQDKFVNDEIDKVINPIIDYKKIIFKPARINSETGEWDLIDKFKINLNFYTPESIDYGSPQHRGIGAQPGVYSDLGFKFDDVFCKTSRFINSFARLSFFDNPYSGKNQLLTFVDIFTQVGPDQKNPYGFPEPIDSSKISLTVGDPVLQPEEIHEGFQMYWFQDLVDNSPNQEYEMYMTVQFNNAANGKIYELAPYKIINPDKILISDLEGTDGIFYLKVILKNDNGIYKYMFTPNITQSDISLTPLGVELTPVGGTIPTLTFWQITVLDN